MTATVLIAAAFALFMSLVGYSVTHVGGTIMACVGA